MAVSPDTPAPAGTAPVLQVTRSEGPTNIVWGFFEPTEGHRVARLQVGTMLREYGKQGVFRVAWKPKIALTGVELKVTDSAAWPQAAPQFADILDSLRAGREMPRLKDLVVIFEDTGVRFEAARGVFEGNGALRLHSARVPGGEPREVLLHLRGERAGQIEILDPGSISPTSPDP